MIKSKKKASHAGPLGQLKSIKPDLLRAVFELREQDMEVDNFLVVVKASTLSSVFNAKSFTTRIEWAHTNHSASQRKFRRRQRTT